MEQNQTTNSFPFKALFSSSPNPKNIPEFFGITDERARQMLDLFQAKRNVFSIENPTKEWSTVNHLETMAEISKTPQEFQFAIFSSGVAQGLHGSERKDSARGLIEMLSEMTDDLRPEGTPFFAEFVAQQRGRRGF